MTDSLHQMTLYLDCRRIPIASAPAPAFNITVSDFLGF
jgi:hypothetical protein